jgi:hypothetical protein
MIGPTPRRGTIDARSWPAPSRLHPLHTLLIVTAVLASAFAIVRLIDRPPVLLETLPGPAGWRVFVEPKNGWSLTYPANWHAQRISELAKTPIYKSSAYGILVSNVEHEMTHPKSESRGASFFSWAPSRFDTKGLPANLAAVEVKWSYGAGFVFPCTHWGSVFPLSLRNASKQVLHLGADGTSQEQFSLGFIARHDPLYQVTAWLGSSASEGDRAIVERIVSSITFDDAPKNPAIIDRPIQGSTAGELTNPSLCGF